MAGERSAEELSVSTKESRSERSSVWVVAITLPKMAMKGRKGEKSVDLWQTLLAQHNEMDSLEKRGQRGMGSGNTSE